MEVVAAAVMAGALEAMAPQVEADGRRWRLVNATSIALGSGPLGPRKSTDSSCAVVALALPSLRRVWRPFALRRVSLRLRCQWHGATGGAAITAAAAIAIGERKTFMR